MSKLPILLLALASIGLAPPLWAGPGSGEPQSPAEARQKRPLAKEATIRDSQQARIEFNEDDAFPCLPRTRLGFDTLDRKSDEGPSDFVRLRLNWNPEIVQSISALEVGTN